MTLQAAPTLLKGDSRIDFYTLALMLAEGQVEDLDTQWDAFIDNLSRITDAFAQVRARSTSKAEEPELLLI